ncbi:hypothetical protein ST12_06240 [Clostridium botulinum]|uniref:Shedu anti-phage system protein SduA domain-containing protein n=1 Tax=Clostridium botulinum TaxID=1491 RepID=UPI000174EAF2|nr:Shedu anti-phage system protein SduA domain-containing protein [Clostridium botulinum]ACD53635.1 conserved hypothetical protein [Clostridium botulinum E3 str. Alaska E43]AJF29302.1 hypothetical protein ST13_06240 [Clostridium botulinum]AJF32363.1 hypothetical protein ST12_06240 [Clostridium botulinum]MBY6789563.1 DUF4263 domain-containing protein [Clostridium botulinum]MBY6817246.1 DUF4263 domain-containing protein [Clostridium botulinum]
MIKEYCYKEPEEWTKRRNTIRKNQIPIETIANLVGDGANEREIQKVIKKDLSFLADYLQSPIDEYICLSELPIGDNVVDFVVLTSRSRMLVYLIEIKGADFFTVKSNHYKGMNSHIHDAVNQIGNHISYIEQNYETFRKYIHGIREQVINGDYKSNYLLGPKGHLEVDQNKDIEIETIVIGGKSKEDYTDSNERTRFESKNKYWLHVYSWESFLRRIDKVHGHYFE